MSDRVRGGVPRAAARIARRRLVRLLHPWRRARALRRLRAIRPVRSALVVCRGNICRSPFGAQYLERLFADLDPPVRVVSGGFLAPGRPPPAAALAAALERGVDMRWHLSRTLGPDLVRGADLVLVMEPVQQRELSRSFPDRRRHIFHLGDFDPGSVESRTIADPYSGSLGDFRACYGRIERCLRAVAARVRSGLGAAPLRDVHGHRPEADQNWTEDQSSCRSAASTA